MSKRARRSHATYPFVALNAEGPNFVDRKLEAFCGVAVPAGHGLVLLDADGAQVAFGSIAANAATLRKILESAAECAAAEAERASGAEAAAEAGSLRVFLAPSREAFTVPLEFHDGGFRPATCARG